ncbi:MAG: glycine/sarcosine/betaine reductase selenoprotein B family protein [bacterium]|nr:glycine/sarcosine/betaine reductase selenoprotein B family protein [bacterium]
MHFSIVERDFLRKYLPEFDWTGFDTPTKHVPLNKPVEECRVALVTTSGAYLKGKQDPFTVKNLFGDDSYRVIPNDTPVEDIGLAHPGYDTKRAAQDIDAVFPIGLLNALAERGIVGEAAPRHISFMGYIPRTGRLMEEIAPATAGLLNEDGVDLAILVPS